MHCITTIFITQQIINILGNKYTLQLYTRFRSEETCWREGNII